MGCLSSKLGVSNKADFAEDSSTEHSIVACETNGALESKEITRERAPTLHEQHEDFLNKQAQKDVKSILEPQRRRSLSKDVKEDIQLRAGVLPTQTQEQQHITDKADRFFIGTEAQLRAARDRKELEPALAAKRRKSQLEKMKNNEAYQTPAGKKALEFALEKEKGTTSFYGIGQEPHDRGGALKEAITLTVKPIEDLPSKEPPHD
jgi:hypothetical protein